VAATLARSANFSACSSSHFLLCKFRDIAETVNEFFKRWVASESKRVDHTRHVAALVVYIVPFVDAQHRGLGEQNLIGRHNVLDAVIRSKEFTKNVVPTDQILLTKPTVLRVNEWHDVNNEGSDVPRMIYSLRFAGNPTFEELIDRFGNIPELT
jgi:hypothetical protein